MTSILTIIYCCTYSCFEAQKLLLLVNQRSKCHTKLRRCIAITMLNQWVEAVHKLQVSIQNSNQFPSEFLLYIEKALALVHYI